MREEEKKYRKLMVSIERNSEVNGTKSRGRDMNFINCTQSKVIFISIFHFFFY